MFAGNSTIEVRVSEPTKSANTSQTETDKTNDDAQVKTENIDEVLNESLNNQIIDLLSSIREEEENKTSTDKTDNEVEQIENETTGVKTENGATEVKTESNGEDEVEGTENKNIETVKIEGKDTGRATPTRASARIATSTPNTIRTRRASKLAQN